MKALWILTLLIGLISCNKQENKKNDVTKERYDQTLVSGFAGQWLSDIEEVENRDEFPEKMTFRRQSTPVDWSEIRQCRNVPGFNAEDEEDNPASPFNDGGQDAQARKNKVQSLLILQSSGDYELVSRVMIPFFGNEIECLTEPTTGKIEFDSDSENQEFQVGDQTGTIEVVDENTFDVSFQ